MEKEITQERILEIIQENYNKFKGSNEAELMSSHDIFDLISEQKAEIERLTKERNDCVADAVHLTNRIKTHYTPEIERLRKAGGEIESKGRELLKQYTRVLCHYNDLVNASDFVDSTKLKEFFDLLSNWNALTKKEGNNG